MAEEPSEAASALRLATAPGGKRGNDRSASHSSAETGVTCSEADCSSKRLRLAALRSTRKHFAKLDGESLTIEGRPSAAPSEPHAEPSPANEVGARAAPTFLWPTRR